MISMGKDEAEGHGEVTVVSLAEFRKEGMETVDETERETKWMVLS